MAMSTSSQPMCHRQTEERCGGLIGTARLCKSDSSGAHKTHPVLLIDHEQTYSHCRRIAELKTELLTCALITNKHVAFNSLQGALGLCDNHQKI